MHIRVIIRLALRNLRRQLRRTVLTASSMVVGGGLLIFSYALGDGSHESWIDAGVRTGSGHVTVEGPEFRLTKRIEDRLPTNVRGEVEQLLASPEMASQVVAVSARPSGGAMISMLAPCVASKPSWRRREIKDWGSRERTGKTQKVWSSPWCPSNSAAGLVARRSRSPIAVRRARVFESKRRSLRRNSASSGVQGRFSICGRSSSPGKPRAKLLRT